MMAESEGGSLVSAFQCADAFSYLQSATTAEMEAYIQDAGDVASPRARSPSGSPRRRPSFGFSSPSSALPSKLRVSGKTSAFFRSYFNTGNSPSRPASSPTRSPHKALRRQPSSPATLRGDGTGSSWPPIDSGSTFPASPSRPMTTPSAPSSPTKCVTRSPSSPCLRAAGAAANQFPSRAPLRKRKRTLATSNSFVLQTSASPSRKHRGHAVEDFLEGIDSCADLLTTNGHASSSSPKRDRSRAAERHQDDVFPYIPRAGGGFLASGPVGTGFLANVDIPHQCMGPRQQMRRPRVHAQMVRSLHSQDITQSDADADTLEQVRAFQILVETESQFYQEYIMQTQRRDELKIMVDDEEAPEARSRMADAIRDAETEAQAAMQKVVVARKQLSSTVDEEVLRDFCGVGFMWDEVGVKRADKGRLFTSPRKAPESPKRTQSPRRCMSPHVRVLPPRESRSPSPNKVLGDVLVVEKL